MEQVNRYLVVASVLFASGGAFALVTQSASETPIMQKAIAENAQTLIRLTTLQEVSDKVQASMNSKLDWLIKREMEK